MGAFLILLFLLDQHRLQPWAYQTALYSMVFASMNASAARRWLLPLAASVYIYSALGKFDYQFVHTVGIDFLKAIARPIGGLPAHVSISRLAMIAYLFPATELLLGVLLLPKFSRRVAGVAAMIMHASLIGILGPWSLNHSAGVLVWNLLLMIQSWFLFVRPANRSDREHPAIEFSRGATFASVVVMLAIILPLLERRGFWDHWPSWALYSPHNSRFDVEIHRSGIGLVPAAVSPFVEQDSNGDGWHALALDRWSLETRKVPIYPQARYQLGLAVKLAESGNINDQIRGRLRGVSDRKTGKRTEQFLLGQAELQQATNRFWLLPHR